MFVVCESGCGGGHVGKSDAAFFFSRVLVRKVGGPDDPTCTPSSDRSSSLKLILPYIKAFKGEVRFHRLRCISALPQQSHLFISSDDLL